jgi:hypothetical protein
MWKQKSLCHFINFKIGVLTNSLTYFAHYIKQKRDRWIGTGVRNVGTSSWLANLNGHLQFSFEDG